MRISTRFCLPGATRLHISCLDDGHTLTRGRAAQTLRKCHIRHEVAMYSGHVGRPGPQAIAYAAIELPLPSRAAASTRCQYHAAGYGGKALPNGAAYFSGEFYASCQYRISKYCHAMISATFHEMRHHFHDDFRLMPRRGRIGILYFSIL